VDGSAFGADVGAERQLIGEAELLVPKGIRRGRHHCPALYTAFYTPFETSPREGAEMNFLKSLEYR
jgi:hypothetical protein